MKLCDIEDIARQDDFSSWLSVDTQCVRITLPLAKYAGTYSAGGIVSSNMASAIVRELTANPIATAWLYITMPHPEEPAREVLFFVLGIAEQDFILCRTVIEFDAADTERLTATLAWLLACDSQFTLIDPKNHLLVVNSDDRRIQFSWDTSASMHAHVEDFMAACDYLKQ